MSVATVFAALVWIECAKEERAVVGNSLAPLADVVAHCCNCPDCRITTAEDGAHSRMYSQDAAAVAKARMKTMEFDRRAAFAHPYHHLELDLAIAVRKKAGAADGSDTWNAAVPSALGWAVLDQLQCQYYSNLAVVLGLRHCLADWARYIQRQRRQTTRPVENALR